MEQATPRTLKGAVPFFAYAMLIDENNFGNGVGLNQDTDILSLFVGPHYFNTKRRVIEIGMEDMFHFSSKVGTQEFVPKFTSISDGIMRLLTKKKYIAERFLLLVKERRINKDARIYDYSRIQ